MDYIMPISEVRARFPEMIKKIMATGKHLIITKNGHANAIVLSPAEFETLEIKADHGLMQSLIRAQEDFGKGRTYSHEDVFKDV